MTLRASLVLALALAGCASDPDGPASPDAAPSPDTAAADAAAATPDAAPDADAPDAGSTADAPAVDAAPAARCNGWAHLCARPFDQVVYASAHNAMSNADAGWLAPNQHHGITRQLGDGIRNLMLDVHPFDGQLYLCHGYCELAGVDMGRQPFADGLTEVGDFLAANPREVVSIIFERHAPVADTVAAIAASGLADLALVPGPPEAPRWPTLGEMVDSGQRLVLFDEGGGGGAPWYLAAWSYIFDTPYSFEYAEDFDCGPNRGSADNSLFLVNHWLTRPLPHEGFAAEVNIASVLLPRVLQCADQFARLPTFIGVDFYDVGDLLAVVDALNAETGAPWPRPAAPPR